MSADLLATASITVNASASRVWSALVSAEAIREYMFGTEVTTEWRPGSSISWKGEWKGESYEDRGTILQVRPSEVLQYTHYSPLSGLPDAPESYHTITIRLSRPGERTRVTLTQDGNQTEEARQHSEENWMMMLEGLKKYVEK